MLFLDLEYGSWPLFLVLEPWLGSEAAGWDLVLVPILGAGLGLVELISDALPPDVVLGPCLAEVLGPRVVLLAEGC